MADPTVFPSDHPAENAPEPGDKPTLDELFESLYIEHYPALLSFFGRRGLGPEVSRELAQDAMLRAYDGLGGFEGRSQARTWILRIAANIWKNWVRDHRGTAKRQGREDSLGEDGLQVADQGGLWGSIGRNPERRAVERQAVERIWSRVSALSPRQRECLRLWLKGWSYQEICEQLGASMQTVRASLHRAKARIEAELGPDFRVRTQPAGEGS